MQFYFQSISVWYVMLQLMCLRKAIKQLGYVHSHVAVTHLTFSSPSVITPRSVMDGN